MQLHVEKLCILNENNSHIKYTNHTLTGHLFITVKVSKSRLLVTLGHYLYVLIVISIPILKITCPCHTSCLHQRHCQLRASTLITETWPLQLMVIDKFWC